MTFSSKTQQQNKVLPRTIYTQQMLDPIIREQSLLSHLEIDFQLDSGATLNILNTDTWNEIKEHHKLQLKALLFVLSAAANNSKLQSKSTVNLQSTQR